MRPDYKILPVIVFAQFYCTSLWFAGNAVMGDLLLNFQLEPGALGHLTSAVQFGFIIGTLAFAFLSISDRFSPSRLFFICALVGAAINLGMLLPSQNLFSLAAIRFFTGFSLAGIYPVGMKIASDHFDKGLGRSLGFLVGALVLGTAFPHFLKAFSQEIDLGWRSVIIFISLLALAGGLLILLFVPDGPYRTKRTKTELKLVFRIFKNSDFRSAAFGYFGHMWELYAFWAFVPVILGLYKEFHPGIELNISLASFFIIGLGGVACALAGYISEYAGTKRTARIILLLSGACCLCSPLLFYFESESLLLVFLIFWGLVVVADSPLFSTLVAKNTSPDARGTALTIVNCIGFSITILSIQLINFLNEKFSATYLFLILAIGPFLGVLALVNRRK